MRNAMDKGKSRARSLFILSRHRPQYEANRYEGRIKEGGILLSVHADDSDWKNKGKEILKRTGAEDIGTKGEAGADSQDADIHTTTKGERR